MTFAEPDPVNKLPFDVQINGNKSGTVGDTLTFTASAKDRDATTDPPRFTYSFDLDGDGNFDYNSANSATVAKRFDTPGTYNVGVRVLDEDGGAGYASMAVTINGVPQALPAPIAAKPTPVAPLSSFTLGKPVFGGSNNRSLVVSYRLREASTVTVALYRGNRRIRTLSTGSRSANRTYRLTVKATRSLQPRHVHDPPGSENRGRPDAERPAVSEAALTSATGSTGRARTPGAARRSCARTRRSRRR